MNTLSQRLRQIRAWQFLTLAEVAEHARQTEKWLTQFESGVLLYEQYKHTLPLLPSAYGIGESLLRNLLDHEYAWRVSVKSATRWEAMPRMAHYIYRPLPEAACNLFRDGFVVLDCETTGKDPHGTETRICEISILDTSGATLLNSLVNPEVPIPADVQALHGISDAMVAGAPTFHDLGPEIFRLLNGQIVVIYNAGYDGWLLDRQFIESGLDMPDFQPWCLMEAYAEHWKAPGRFGNYAWQKLSAASEQQGLEWDEDAHRSLADATMTWRLLQKLARREE